VLEISREALREGCDRAHDLFLLNRLQGPEAATRTTANVFAGLGIDEDMRADLTRALTDIVPVNGVPALEAMASTAMLAGALVGLLIADATTPSGELDVPVVRRR
jgi:hypothetical protein